MTLTPPKIGDLAARCRAQRLREKNPWRASNAVGRKVADATDKKPLAASNGDDEKIARLLIL
jgi:hypothetical protein